MSTAAPALTSDARPMTSPYKELSYYEESDSANFAGREQDVHQLLSRVVISRAFVLYARSGLGKTSVLLAGLFPELRKRDYRPIYVRTLDDPLRDLKAAVARECGLSAEENSLRSLLQQDCQNGSPVIALDQFEEFFIRFRDQPAKRAEFVRETAAVIADESVDVHVIFSVREDHLVALDDMQRRLPHLFTQSYRLMPLTAFGAREAIVRPLLKNGVPYDERLITRLVDELAKFDFESARLQITCAELYRSAFEREQDAIHLTEEDLTRLERQLRDLEWKSTVDISSGTAPSPSFTTARRALLEGVFQRYLQRAIAPVEARHPFLSRVVLDEMITRQETKYALPLSELALRITSTQEDLREVVESLVGRNLIRVSTRGGHPWYEIVHECLVPEIRRWLTLSEEFVGFRDALELIVTGSRRRGWRKQTAMLLPREQLLKVIAPHDERLKLDANEIEFVLRSAICHRADDLPFWAARYEGDFAKLIGTLLDDPSPEMRAGAAASAGSLQLQDRAVAEKCQRLALTAEEPNPVRRAAGEALATIATDEQLASLQRECRWRHTPVQVRELLADLALRNRLRPACGFWGRSIAKRHARKRLMRERAADIEADRWAATQAGLWGGLAWTFTSALVFSTLSIWLGSSTSPYPYPIFILSVVVASLTLGLSLGTLTGWGIGRSRACAGILGKRPLWLRSVIGSKTIFWLHFTVGLAVVSYFKNLNVWVALGLIVVWGMLFQWLIGLAAELSRPCFDGPISRAGALFWSFIVSLVLGLVPAVILLIAVSPWLYDSLKDTDPIGTISALIVVTLSISILVVTFALALHDRREAVAFNKIRRGVVRSIFLLAALLILPAYLATFGFASSPLFAKRCVLPGNDISAHFSFWPETDHFRLISQPGAIFHVTVPPAASLRLGEGQTIKRGYSDSLMKLSKGAAPLAVVNERHEHGAATAPVILRNVLRLSISDKNPGKANDPAIGNVGGFIASEADGRTSLTLSGKVSSTLQPEEVIKVFLFDPEKNRFLPESDIEKQGANTVYVNRPRPWRMSSEVESGERFLPFRVLNEKGGEWSLKLYRQERLDATIPGKQAEERDHLAPAVSVDVGVAVIPIRGDELAVDAELLAAQERFAEAVVLERRALEMMGPNPDAYYLNLHAWTLFRLGEFKESLPHSRGAPWDPHRGATVRGEFDESLRYSRRAVALDSQSNYLDTLAHAAYSCGLWKEAVDAWDVILARDGHFTSDAYCKDDAVFYAKARANAGLPPRKLPPNP